MNLKTKAVALLAGSALALSVASGAMAADETTVTLNDGAACTGGIASGSFDFGTYTWNGETGTYDQNNAPSGSLTIEASNDQYAQPDCSVTVTPGDLDGPATTPVIPGADVILSVTSGSASSASPYTVTSGTDLVLGDRDQDRAAVVASGSSDVQDGNQWNAGFTMQPPTVPPGDYSGTILVTIANGG